MVYPKELEWVQHRRQTRNNCAQVQRLDREARELEERTTRVEARIQQQQRLHEQQATPRAWQMRPSLLYLRIPVQGTGWPANTALRRVARLRSPFRAIEHCTHPDPSPNTLE